MTRLSIKLVALTLIFIMPAFGVAQKRKSRGTTLIGYISDSNHGLEHPAGVDEVMCTLECAREGKFVLADRENKVVYQLDRVGQRKAKQFAGQKVKVRGHLVGKTMRVITISETL